MNEPKMIRALAALAALSASLGLVSTALATDSGATNITAIWDYGGSAVVRIDGTITGTSCTTKDGFKILNVSTTGMSMFKTVLAAKLAGKPIEVNVSGCSGQFPIADVVVLK